MKVQNNESDGLIRVFKKANGRIEDYTRPKRKNYYKIDNVKAATEPTVSKPVKTRTVTITIPAPKAESTNSGKPRLTGKVLIDSFDATLKRAKADLKTSSDSLKDRGIEHPDNDPNKEPKVYYIKNGQYYVMWYKEKVWAFMTLHPRWCWLTTFQTNATGGFYHANKDDFEDILKSKYTYKDLQVAYRVYKPTDWDFKTEKEREDYVSLNRLVNYNKAEKI